MAHEITSGDLLSKEDLSNHIKIYAGPGAGKTHFLVENVKNIVTTHELITNGKSRKVLCITYTNAAVDEIVNRLDKFTNYVECYTIHGFIIEHIIKPFQTNLIHLMKLDFGINVSKKGKISSQVEGMGILHGIEKKDIYTFIQDKKNTKKELGYSKKIMSEIEVDNVKFIESIKNEDGNKYSLKSSNRIDEEDIKPIKEYIWSVVRKLTHNEILYFGFRILQINPVALYTIRVQFPFIFVDEFQDTNPLQTMLIKLIGEKSTRVSVVGDVAQSIYSFQGAKLSYFTNFKLNDNDKEYVINGNRRSTVNIVNFCNFIRQSNSDVIQISQKKYENNEKKETVETKKIHFLLGTSANIKNLINDLILQKGVVLTRTWTAAFKYIQNISDEQATILRNIYNNYFSSPIQLRDDIAEHNNVTWVRAFRFIFNLWNSYKCRYFIDMISALRLYFDIDVRAIKPKVIIEMNKLSDNLFSNLNENDFTYDVLEKFNECIKRPEYINFKNLISDDIFEIPIFSEFDRDDLKNNIQQLQWGTSYKLFNEVFSDKSRYMTVHQAKGLEWKKVIVSVIPNNRNDNISLSQMYGSPQLINERPADEFTRMYYVACSRAKEDLYIHIEDESLKSTIENSLKVFIEKTEMNIDYEFIGGN